MGGEGAAEPAEAAEQEGFSFDFSNLPDQPGAAAPAAEVPSPDRQADGIDFGDIDQTETLATDGEPQAGMEIESHSHAVDRPLSDRDGADEPQAGSTEAAAAELRSRVNELLAEALTNYEQGRKDEALGILNRVFILDESNSAALALHDNICAELDAEQGVTDLPATADSPVAEADAAPAERAVTGNDATAEDEAVRDDDLEDLEALQLDPPTAEPAEAPAAPAPAGTSLPMNWTPSSSRTIFLPGRPSPRPARNDVSAVAS